MTDRDSAIGAIHYFSDLAADFKVGIVDNNEVRENLGLAFAGLGLTEDEVALEVKEAMTSWGEWDDE
jgi:hypothetical protein